MSVVQVSSAPSRELYEKVAARAGIAVERPAGLVLHTAHELSDGSVQIVDIFESREALERFGQDRMLPAFQDAGVLELVLERGRPTAYDAFDEVR
jgi:hypothetical protein